MNVFIAAWAINFLISLLDAGKLPFIPTIFSPQWARPFSLCRRVILCSWYSLESDNFYCDSAPNILIDTSLPARSSCGLSSPREQSFCWENYGSSLAVRWGRARPMINHLKSLLSHWLRQSHAAFWLAENLNMINKT